MYKKILLLYLLFFYSSIFPQDSKYDIIKLFSGAFFTEGPAYADNGDIYFCDLTFTEETGMDAGIIWKYDSNKDTTSVYRSPSGMAGGMKIDALGNLLVCEGADYGGRRVTKTDLSTGKSKIITGRYNGHPYNSPNDLVTDRRGRIYFTDPRYTGWEKIEQPCFGVYMMDIDNTVKLVSAEIKMPNGIALSPDQSVLYVGCNFEGDSDAKTEAEYAIYTFLISGNGSLTKKAEYDMGDNAPDGMAMDASGFLYVASRNEADPAIIIFDTNSGFKISDKIPLPEVPSNLTFGKAKDENFLFITAGKSLYKVKLHTKELNEKKN